MGGVFLIRNFQKSIFVLVKNSPFLVWGKEIVQKAAGLAGDTKGIFFTELLDVISLVASNGFRGSFVQWSYKLCWD